MEAYIITGLILPITVYIVKFFIDRFKKQTEEKDKSITDDIKELQAKVKELESHKVSKVELDNLEISLTKLWDTFREDQKDQSKEIGILTGKLLDKDKD